MLEEVYQAVVDNSIRQFIFCSGKGGRKRHKHGNKCRALEVMLSLLRRSECLDFESPDVLSGKCANVQKDQLSSKRTLKL